VPAGPITEGPDGARFQADIAEVVHTHLDPEATMLVVEWWTPAHGLRRGESECPVIDTCLESYRARSRGGAQWAKKTTATVLAGVAVAVLAGAGVAAVIRY